MPIPARQGRGSRGGRRAYVCEAAVREAFRRSGRGTPSCAPGRAGTGPGSGRGSGPGRLVSGFALEEEWALGGPGRLSGRRELAN